MEEIWKDIKDFEGIYQVSNLGRIRSLDRKVWNYMKKGRILKPSNNGKGYYEIALHGNTKKIKHAYVHRIVAETFIPNPNNYKEVNHKDFNKENNAISNLEWVSSKQNKIHFLKSYRNKRYKEKRKEYFANKTFEFIYKNKNKILNLYNNGYTIEEISKKLKIGRDTISSIIAIFEL